MLQLMLQYCKTSGQCYICTIHVPVRMSPAQVTGNATAHLDSWRLWDVSGRGHGSLDQSGVHRAAVIGLCRHLTSSLHAHLLDEPRKLLLHILQNRPLQSVLCQHVVAQQHRQPFLQWAYCCSLSSMPCWGFSRLCTCESSVLLTRIAM